MPNKSELEQSKASAQRLTEIVSKAKREIDSAEQALAKANETANQYYRVAADHVAEAQKEKASQRQIAAQLGKSTAWVNQLLRWRKEGYRHSPFGPQSSLARARKKDRSGATEHDQGKSATASQNAQADAETAGKKREKAKPASHRSAATDRTSIATNVESEDREMLIKLLGLLGTDQDGECVNAARKVEKLRKKIGLTWDELIVPAEISQARAA